MSWALHPEHQRQVVRLNAQAAEIEQLKQALVDLQKQLLSANSDDPTGSDGDEEECFMPHWDDWDKIYRCTECQWEVVHGKCQHCGEKYPVPDKTPEDSISTDNEALNPDRTSHQRGITPLREIAPCIVPYEYKNRPDEYRELLERGATRLMCETFQLEFHPYIGIIAWADHDLYAEFAGPGMKTGDSWRIRLGRRIELDEEDLDGAEFIQDLLEDAVLFPLRPIISDRVAERWHTQEIGRGVWETRLMVDPNDQVLVDEDEGNSDASYDSDVADRPTPFYDPKLYPGLVNHREQAEKLAQMEDRALEGGAGRVNEVIQAPGYETEGDDADDEADESASPLGLSDPGWSFSATSPDAVWCYDADDMDTDLTGADPTDVVMNDPLNGLPNETNIVYSSSESDSTYSVCDSDGELSGDDDILANTVEGREILAERNRIEVETLDESWCES